MRLKLPEWVHDEIWLDDNNAITYYAVDGVRCGAHWYHRRPGTDECCVGSFKWLNVLPDMAQQATWTLVSAEPLTIQPSLLCMRCSAHGFITEGKWVPV